MDEKKIEEVMALVDSLYWDAQELGRFDCLYTSDSNTEEREACILKIQRIRQLLGEQHG